MKKIHTGTFQFFFSVNFQVDYFKPSYCGSGSYSADSVPTICVTKTQTETFL